MTNKSKKIMSEISAGELLDKISILEIKIEKIKDKYNQEEVKKEYKILKEIQNSSIKIEDEIRSCEKEKDFGQKFIDLARSVYFNNDKRAKIKSEINKILGSNIKEIKKYAKY